MVVIHVSFVSVGYYAYIEGSPPRMPDEVARLLSKEFTPDFNEKCFTFYYMMNGKHTGYLDVHVKTKSNKMVNLFRKNGHQGPDWINAAVNLPDLGEPYRVRTHWKSFYFLLRSYVIYVNGGRTQYMK